LIILRGLDEKISGILSTLVRYYHGYIGRFPHFWVIIT
jgi:hypothetical protein